MKQYDVNGVFQTVIKMLNESEDYLSHAYERQSEIDLRTSDITHFIEEFPDYLSEYYGKETELTPNQCKNLVYFMSDLFKNRRNYKKEQSMYDTLDANRSKLGYYNQRGMLLASLKQKAKSLDTRYKPRRLGYDEIWDIISTNSKGGKTKNIFKEIEYVQVKDKEERENIDVENTKE